MSNLHLIFGNRNYSSWSFRPWLAMKVAGIAFTEDVIPLYRDDSLEVLTAKSPSGKVPILQHGDVKIWDSLAILEYVAELFPQAQLWPQDPAVRAIARSVAAEMHSSFMGLRSHLHMNMRARVPGHGQEHDAVQTDIARIKEVWTLCRERYGRPAAADQGFLFGKFSIADAMYAPVVSRFWTYAVPVDDLCQAYMTTIRTLPAYQEWEKAGAEEPWVIAEEEVNPVV